MGQFLFLEHGSDKYSPVIQENAKNADLTISLSFEENDIETLYAKRIAGNKYEFVPLLDDPVEVARIFYLLIVKHKASVLYIQGADICTLLKHNWTKPRIIKYLFFVLSKIKEFLPIKKIIVGGQSGVETAAAVSAHALGIDVRILFPQGFRQRNAIGLDSFYDRVDIESEFRKLSWSLSNSKLTDPAGSIIVINKRKGCTQSPDGFTVIDGDRNNPILGNPIPLVNKNDDRERARVLRWHRYEILEPDIAQGGPIYLEIEKLAQRIKNGENIALACWCKPLDCHLDAIADFIHQFACGTDIRKMVTSSMQSKGFEFFYGHKFVFSNFHLLPFLVEEKKFCCVEQYYQYKKALYFGDDTVAIKILNCNEPKQCKHLGGSVSNFNAEDWRNIQETIMFEALVAKFTQNKKAMNDLLATGSRILVEASPDRLWGCGLSMDDPKIDNPAQWTGKNRLGALMSRVRDYLKKKLVEKPKMRMLKLAI